MLVNDAVLNKVAQIVVHTYYYYHPSTMLVNDAVLNGSFVSL